MKNKTIFDAVNEFKGDWPYKTEGMVESKSDRVGYEKDELSDYYSDNPDKLNLVWFNFTCNKKGFNALVEEMKNNFGKCLDYQYIAYQLAAKQLLEPTKPEPNTYTQEMFDNGVFPSVGMEFLHEGLVVTTLSTSKEHGGVITFIFQDGLSIGCCWFNDAWVKPLTPPVPLITGKAYQFEHQSGDAVVGIYSESQQSFDNYGIKYYPWHCTNIQPLTLKEK